MVCAVRSMRSALASAEIPVAAESWFADKAIVASLRLSVLFTDGHPFLFGAAGNRTSFL